MQHTQKFLVLLTVFICSCSIFSGCGRHISSNGRLLSSLDTSSGDSLPYIPQDTLSSKDSLRSKDSILSDSLSLLSDSLKALALTGDSLGLQGDSLALQGDNLRAGGALQTDSLALASADTTKKQGVLEAPVHYKANDSIVMTAGNIVHLYGDADVKYQQMELKADLIRISMDSSIVHATYSLDSIGEEFGYPVFVEGDQQIESKHMHYNFKTKKGFSRETITQQGEGYVTAGTTKMVSDNILNMVDGKYTTCDNHDHPHYYIQMTKAKVRPGKNIVTGPAYLVFEDVPIPLLGLPFAFFPFTDSYSSGILMPTYDDERNRGFGLRDGGYYFALSDYVDLAVTGEIYTKGSWGLGAQSSYYKRYKFRGSLDARYRVTKLGDKAIEGDYSKSTDFSVRWSHQQDPKANPTQTFSASVDFSTSNYSRNDPYEQYTMAGMSNNKSSSVSYSKSFPNTPFSISASMNINQRTADSSVSVTLPNMTVTMNRIYPLKRKKAVGGARWYEKISLSYKADIQNSISTREDKLFKSNLIKDWKNGVRHNVKVESTFNLFNNINVTPNFTYNESWVTRKIEKAYDQTRSQVVPVDTTYGFYRLFDYSASLSLSTTLYGFFKPLPIFGKLSEKVDVIRHRMEPRVSISFAPDFGADKYGYYQSLKYLDNNEKEAREIAPYSPFEGGTYGPPSRGRKGSLSFGFSNNVEMKLADKDSTGQQKKISLIDNLSVDWGYNFAADSFKWGDAITVQLRLKFGTYTQNLNLNFDPYTYKNIGKEGERPVGYKVDKMRWSAGKGIARFRSTSLSFNQTFNNDTFKKWFGKKDKDDNKNDNNAPPDDLNPLDDLNPDDPFNENQLANEPVAGQSIRGKQKKEAGEIDDDGYLTHSVPWSFSIDYSLGIGYDAQKFNPKTNEYKYKFTNNLSFNGNIQPTKNWQINFNATYDFDRKTISHMNVNVSRNLHCFTMTASIIPVGPYKNYTFSVAVSSSLLKDLKYQQSSSSFDNRYMQWY